MFRLPRTGVRGRAASAGGLLEGFAASAGGRGYGFVQWRTEYVYPTVNYLRPLAAKLCWQEA